VFVNEQLTWAWLNSVLSSTPSTSVSLTDHLGCPHATLSAAYDYAHGVELKMAVSKATHKRSFELPLAHVRSYQKKRQHRGQGKGGPGKQRSPSQPRWAGGSRASTPHSGRGFQGFRGFRGDYGPRFGAGPALAACGERSAAVPAPRPAALPACPFCASGKYCNFHAH
jgi:hypothetical protein